MMSVTRSSAFQLVAQIDCQALELTPAWSENMAAQHSLHVTAWTTKKHMLLEWHMQHGSHAAGLTLDVMSERLYLLEAVPDSE